MRVHLAYDVRQVRENDDVTQGIARLCGYFSYFKSLANDVMRLNTTSPRLVPLFATTADAYGTVKVRIGSGIHRLQASTSTCNELPVLSLERIRQHSVHYVQVSLDLRMAIATNANQAPNLDIHAREIVEFVHRRSDVGLVRLSLRSDSDVDYKLRYLAMTADENTEVTSTKVRAERDAEDWTRNGESCRRYPSVKTMSNSREVVGLTVLSPRTLDIGSCRGACSRDIPAGNLYQKLIMSHTTGPLTCVPYSTRPVDFLILSKRWPFLEMIHVKDAAIHQCQCVG